MFVAFASMAEYIQLESRNISGKGVLRFPEGNTRTRYYVLFASVFREPTNKYVNFNYNPPRSRYGNLVFLRKGYVVSEAAIEYPKQLFESINDVSGQNLIAIKCAYKGILQTFVNLGVALALPPISVSDTIQNYESLTLVWDECRLVCYGDCAINLQLWRLQYDSCDFLRNDEAPQIEPEGVPASIPAGTPSDIISDPYTSDDDGGNTIPADIDEGASTPVGTPCLQYSVVFSYFDASSVLQEESRIVYGQVGRIRTVAAPGEQHQVQMEFQGFPASEACGAFQYRRLTGANDPTRYDDPAIVSITEV